LVTLSSAYRGEKYGFAQQIRYLSPINTYVQVYEDENNNDVYGYVKTEYTSSVLIENLVSGSSLTSTSGWVGSRLGIGGTKAEI
jgi:hypothetical protein